MEQGRMAETISVEVRAKLYARLEEMSEDEEMSVEEMVDHALRSYVEAFECGDEDAEAECEAEDA